MTTKKEFYTPILNCIKRTTNLTDISKELKISKQNLNYYLSNLLKNGYLTKKDKGWYELTKKSKNSTNYGNFLPKDFIRGHAYVWTIKLPHEIQGWTKRIDILKKNKVNYVLVGALKDIPRIKVLGRKVWLCKNQIRIFDKKDESYYGQNAIESRNKSLNEVYLIVSVLERKLNILLKPFEVDIVKEHYALIKNDLAINQNQKGIVLRVSDESGEWLLVDDSLEKGGELENVGKKAFLTNLPMQNWWNDNKKQDFKVTPSFLLESISGLTQSQQTMVNTLSDYAKHIKSHTTAIKSLSKSMPQLVRILKELKQENTQLKQRRLNEWL